MAASHTLPYSHVIRKSGVLVLNGMESAFKLAPVI